MVRDLDEIADDIRDTTKFYEAADSERVSYLTQAKRVSKECDRLADLMDKYRDELLEAVNSR